MSLKFPYGYARPAGGGPQGMGTLLTWDEMMLRTTMHGLQPEVLDRFYSLIHSAAAVGIPLGCGTGWRETQPDAAGFAKNGNSNHQSFNPPKNAVAIDTVPNISWDWMEANAKFHGFRTFRYVNNEPWHIQPVEIPASRSYRIAPWPLNNFDCPIKRGTTVVVPPPTQGIVNVTVTADPIVLRPENRDAVRGHPDTLWFQRNMAGLFRQTGAAVFDVGNIDGDYGPRCQDACRTFQALNQLEADAVCGQQTWTKLLNP